MRHIAIQEVLDVSAIGRFGLGSCGSYGGASGS
jgi:hypothetical protein